jgi:hypothetical protein
MTDTQDEDPLAPVPTISQRDAGEKIERTLFEGIPMHLRRPLIDWLTEVPDGETVIRRAFSRLRVALRDPRLSCRGHLAGIINQTHGLTRPKCNALDVLNATLALHPANGSQASRHVKIEWRNMLIDLDQRLIDCGSAWTVDPDAAGLYRRTDETAIRARELAEASARSAGRPTSAQHLANAWRKTYGINPEPTDAYGDAVKAVEAAACPVVLDRAAANGTATIYRVRDHLRDAGHRWTFTLVNDSSSPAGTGSIDTVLAMINRLLSGQTGRHDVDGNTVSNRPSTIEEAQAAVHLAAVLVQWFTTNAIRKC